VPAILELPLVHIIIPAAPAVQSLNTLRSQRNLHAIGFVGFTVRLGHWQYHRYLVTPSFARGVQPKRQCYEEPDRGTNQEES